MARREKLTQRKVTSNCPRITTPTETMMPTPVMSQVILLISLAMDDTLSLYLNMISYIEMGMGTASIIP